MRLRDIKPGEAIRFNNEVCIIVDRTEVTRGNLRTYWQVNLRNLMKGNIFLQKFSPDDNMEVVPMHREPYEYLYQDGEMLVFMHPENYEQISVAMDLIPEKQRGFLIPNMRLNLVNVDEKIALVEMPQSIEVTVTDAPEAARGDTATAVTKMAMIETGIEVRVPGHIKTGDRIKVRVEDGEFQGRVN
jgi:elongation factor P